ncbi:Acetate--CoA ligase [Penicillium riverlandense]|uniref:Acetate--CoA ligase n=1 Tax=Penicillium riverlandense TaxID=1903569 RepID=UPI00254992E8|nr:Acetate--CoA ligase [Penicillium riverlandense]KAJ5811676.1 Acetate--CoA ligase [Penicillium riverlandense]
MSSYSQDIVQELSLRDPEAFWSHHAKQLHWHRRPSQALRRTTKHLPNGVSHEHWTWFPDGEISTTYNCIHRHVDNGHGENVAIIWESPVSGRKQKFTYRQLQTEVELLAGVLREEGVRKGDVVLIYMPMIPATMIAALATVHLGAIHAAVFGGFASTSLAQRIEAARPKVVMTASCGIEGSKGPLAYRPLVEGALTKSVFKPEKVIIWQRKQLLWNDLDEGRGQRDWQNLTDSARLRGVKMEPVPVKSDDGLYVIYTSGTTGQPKGVLREAGGHAVGLHLSIQYIFGLRGPGDVIFCASDIGWVVGHSYILYAPLLAGATTILYEGKPIGTPDAGAFWQLVEEHRVNVLFTAPTALRAICKEDPDNQFFHTVGRRDGLRSLRALFLAGEQSGSKLIVTFQDLLKKYAALGAVVIDNWWSSESGSPISALALHSPAGQVDDSPGEVARPLPVKPGSAGKPMPGFDVRVVDDSGKEVRPGTMGNIVLAIPLGPTACTTLFNDHDRYYRGYLKRFNGRWVDTGDAGMIDPDGYVHVMSRSDDIINVAAHRFSTGAIEQAILLHPDVSEASVVGIPDTLKGHLPFAFIQPRSGPSGSHSIPAIPPSDFFHAVNRLVRGHVGSIASLGGIIQGHGMIPKTRSGKTLRRVLRELVENAAQGRYTAAVNIPPTVEDPAVVEVARMRVKAYFDERRAKQEQAKL